MGKAFSSNQTSQDELKFTIGHSGSSGPGGYQGHWRQGRSGNCHNLEEPKCDN